MSTQTASLDQAVSDFVRVRPRLLSIAYRIVGNTHEAEDVVQDAWLRWHRTDRTTISDPQAFLVTTTSRLAINVVQSARRRHETYVAPWLSEEKAADDTDPQAQTEHREAVDDAVRLLLERLSPAERASFVLREGFEYPYRLVAEALRIGAPSARQLAKRARDRVAAGRRQPVTPAAHSRLRQALTTAARTGDLVSLERLLSTDLEEGRNDAVAERRTALASDEGWWSHDDRQVPARAARATGGVVAAGPAGGRGALRTGAGAGRPW